MEGLVKATVIERSDDTVYLQDDTYELRIGRLQWITLLKNGYKTATDSELMIWQYLAQQGYAVPLFFGIDHWANGKTAIELGIAIEKNKTVEK